MTTSGIKVSTMKILEKKQFLVLVTLIGLMGIATSYYLGIREMPNGINDLWGNTPKNIKPLYYITTSLAFIGFSFAFFYVVFKTDLFNYYPITRSVIIIMVASMLWLPYTAEMVNDPTSFTWIKTRIALLLVGLGSWFFFRRMWFMQDQEESRWKKLAVIGSGIFFFHTMVMDAILWPMWFR